MLVALALASTLGVRGRTAAQAPCVVTAELDGVVNEGTASYLRSALEEAERGRCVLLVRLDTPGGTLEATRRIVREFLGARTPVVVHVAPAAARAGSAGVFVAMAAHVLAMAPGSNIGAAHPVTLGGGDPEERGGEQLARKIENDTAAMARAVALQRGRNPEWAEAAVRESTSATASEAQRLGVIDLVIASEGDLLEAIDGREVAVGTGELVAMRTSGAEVREHPMTIQQRAQAFLGDPTLAYALLMIGMLGLVLEMYSPGFGVAGGIGLLSLLLAAIGLDLLPVNVGGVVLVAVALALFLAELYVTSYGLLALAGVACLVGGAALLIDRSDPGFFADPSVRVSWGVVLPLAIVIGAATTLLGLSVRRSRARQQQTGAEGMIGETGVALTDIDARGGAAWIHGERWSAVSRAPVAAGSALRVTRLEGLLVTVEVVEDVVAAGAGGAEEELA